MSWLLAKLSGKSDSILQESSTPSSTPTLYPSIPQPEPGGSLPYNISHTIEPTPTIPALSSDVLPNTLDAMKVKFKFLYDVNNEDEDLKQTLLLVQRTQQLNRDMDKFISEIEKVDFELERSLVSS